MYKHKKGYTFKPQYCQKIKIKSSKINFLKKGYTGDYMVKLTLQDL
jgi:hypothetical protein